METRPCHEQRRRCGPKWILFKPARPARFGWEVRRNLTSTCTADAVRTNTHRPSGYVPSPRCHGDRKADATPCRARARSVRRPTSLRFSVEKLGIAAVHLVLDGVCGMPRQGLLQIPTKLMGVTATHAEEPSARESGKETEGSPSELRHPVPVRGARPQRPRRLHRRARVGAVIRPPHLKAMLARVAQSDIGPLSFRRSIAWRETSRITSRSAPPCAATAAS